jgi:hypothetical protein
MKFGFDNVLLNQFNLIKNNNKMRLGLDIHGVIDAAPNFFSLITKLLSDNGHEVFVITGSHITDSIISEMGSYGIHYHKLLSVSDYNKENGESVNYDSNGNPWFDDVIWNKTKGILCEKYCIDFHIDDSNTYGEFFSTPYAKINIISDMTKRNHKLSSVHHDKP